MKLSLKAARINKGFTQDEAAKAIGISVATVQNYENGRNFPDVPIIRKIEQAYGVSYADLIFLPEIRL